MSRMIRLLVASLIVLIGFAGVMEGAGAQGGATGTVTVLKYYCTYLEETLQVEAIDTIECTPGAATFTFYLVGDGTNDFEQLNVGADGQEIIELPAGSYEVVEEGSQAHFMVTVTAGQNVQLLIGNPATAPAPAPVEETGTVTVLKYYCTYLDETLLVEAIEQDKCSPGAATFTFYLVGDGTNEFQQLAVGVNGQGSIELAAGSYEVVEEGSQAHFMVNVLAGGNAQLLIANPAADVAPAPTAVPHPTAVPAKPAAAPAQPVRLPNTGSGLASGTGALTVALTAVAAIAGSGAVILRTSRDG